MYARRRSHGNESHESNEYIISDQAGIMKTTDVRVTHQGKGPTVEEVDLSRFDPSPV